MIALAGNRDIYFRFVYIIHGIAHVKIHICFRANVFEKDGVSLSPNHEGTHWVRIEQPKENKIIFKQVIFS